MEDYKYSSILPTFILDKQVSVWIRDDFPNFDFAAFVLSDTCVTSKIVLKEPCTFAGQLFVNAIFSKLNCSVTWNYNDGDKITDTPVDIALVTGPAANVLQGQRLVINILSRVSGIATLACKCQNSLSKVNWKGRLTGTSDCTPGFKMAEKYAFMISGVSPHAYDSSSLISFKETHVDIINAIKSKSAGSKSLENYKQLVESARRLAGSTIKVEIEAQSEAEATYAADAGADIVLLTSMNSQMCGKISQNIKRKYPRILIEVGGPDISESNMTSFALPSIDFICMSKLSQGYPTIDFSFSIVESHSVDASTMSNGFESAVTTTAASSSLKRPVVAMIKADFSSPSGITVVGNKESSVEESTGSISIKDVDTLSATSVSNDLTSINNRNRTQQKDTPPEKRQKLDNADNDDDVIMVPSEQIPGLSLIAPNKPSPAVKTVVNISGGRASTGNNASNKPQQITTSANKEPVVVTPAVSKQPITAPTVNKQPITAPTTAKQTTPAAANKQQTIVVTPRITVISQTRVTPTINQAVTSTPKTSAAVTSSSAPAKTTQSSNQSAKPQSTTPTTISTTKSVVTTANSSSNFRVATPVANKATAAVAKPTTAVTSVVAKTNASGGSFKDNSRSNTLGSNNKQQQISHQKPAANSQQYNTSANSNDQGRYHGNTSSNASMTHSRDSSVVKKHNDDDYRDMLDVDFDGADVDYTVEESYENSEVVYDSNPVVINTSANNNTSFNTNNNNTYNQVKEQQRGYPNDSKPVIVNNNRGFHSSAFRGGKQSGSVGSYNNRDNAGYSDQQQQHGNRGQQSSRGGDRNNLNLNRAVASEHHAVAPIPQWRQSAQQQLQQKLVDDPSRRSYNNVDQQHYQQQPVVIHQQAPPPQMMNNQQAMQPYQQSYAPQQQQSQVMQSQQPARPVQMRAPYQQQQQQMMIASSLLPGIQHGVQQQGGGSVPRMASTAGLQLNAAVARGQMMPPVQQQQVPMQQQGQRVIIPPAPQPQPYEHDHVAMMGRVPQQSMAAPSWRTRGYP